MVLNRVNWSKNMVPEFSLHVILTNFQNHILVVTQIQTITSSRYDNKYNINNYRFTRIICNAYLYNILYPRC